MSLEQIPRRGYVKEVTPLEKAENFSKALGGEVNIYIKRDDLLPGCLGGNKTRKLDFVIADAVAKGADTLITCGAVQSNHCRLTLSWSRVEGMECHLILEERIPNSFKEDGSGNHLLFQLMGAESYRAVPKGTDMMAEMQKEFDRLTKLGKKPYIIPGGASNEIGAMGYVSCFYEMEQQFFQQGIKPDYLVVPSGSTGTHAGILAGAYAHHSPISVIGIGVNRPRGPQTEAVAALSNKVLKKLGISEELPREKIDCRDEFVGEGYSVRTQGMVDALKLLVRTEGILVDPVYSGKVLDGMVTLVKEGYFPKGSNIVFLHTGGSPAVFAYKDYFKS